MARSMTIDDLNVVDPELPIDLDAAPRKLPTGRDIKFE
jgi:hypothetical protein